MEDIYDIVKNVDNIYNSDNAFNILKDFERVLDELDVYVYDNWMDGELCSGPNIERHWITCKFMWPRAKMPDPMGGKRLLDYDCKVSYQKTYVIVPRQIRKPDDIRPGTKKGKLDRHGVWIVEIQMPKKLIADIFTNTQDMEEFESSPATASGQPASPPQGADPLAGLGGLGGGAPAPAPTEGDLGGAPAPGGEPGGEL